MVERMRGTINPESKNALRTVKSPESIVSAFVLDGAELMNYQLTKHKGLENDKSQGDSVECQRPSLTTTLIRTIYHRETNQLSDSP